MATFDKVELQGKWPTSSDTGTLSADDVLLSEAATLDKDCFAASISFKADNTGTPDPADIVYFRILPTSGDPDGASTDEYDTPVSSIPTIAHIDTDATELDGTTAADPGIKTVGLPEWAIAAKSFKVHADGKEAGTASNITVSFTVSQHLVL